MTSEEDLTLNMAAGKSFDPEALKQKIIESLNDFDLDEAEKQDIARQQVESMGIYRIENGSCPLGANTPMACMFCPTGHMTECHYPYSCEEANCGHYQAQLAQEEVE